jgi:enoyl-CoA hydratase
VAAASLSIAQTGKVLLLVIDRPAVRNALDPPTLVALADAIDAGTADTTVGAAVITGAGAECFSSGVDLRAVRSGGQEVGAAVHRFHTSIRSPSRLPIVAAVRGMAIGGGFELMLMCDLAVASDDARFGLPEVTRGLVPGGGGTLLPARIPLAVALEIGLLGTPIDASRALSLGLVNRISPTGQVVEDALGLAARLADNPPATLARIRELMWITALEGPAASLAAAAAGPPDERRNAEAAEGMGRFLAGHRGH